MTVKKIKIDTPIIRLDQLLKWAEVVNSGGEAKYLIIDGQVKLNGILETRRGKTIHPGDQIEIKNWGTLEVN